MKLSVIIACRNSEKTIYKCLNSLYGNFKKLDANFEVIVVDDFSDDKTVDIVSQFPVMVIKLERNYGQAYARNIGAFKSRGDVLLFIDSDVEIKCDVIKETTVLFKADDKISIIQGIYSEDVYPNRFASKYRNVYKNYKVSKIKDSYIGGLNSYCFAIKKKVFDSLGGFNSHFNGVEDVEFQIRIVEDGYRIFLNRNLKVKHLKEYSLLSLLKTDFKKAHSKAILMFKRRDMKKLSFSLNRAKDNIREFVSIFLAFSFFVGIFLKSLLVMLSSFSLFLFLNSGFMVFISYRYGNLFAIKSILLYFLELFFSSFALLSASIHFVFHNIAILCDFLKDILRWSYRILFSKKYPEQFIFYITNKCNLSCEHCFLWTKNNQGKKDFKIDEINKVLKSIGSFSFLSLSGGEPFLRDDIADIAEMFVRYNGVRRISIPTNGTMPERIYRLCDIMLSRLPLNVEVIVKISVDGIGKVHDKIRGMNGSFNLVSESFRRITSLKKKHKNLKVGAIITANSLNQSEIFEIYRHIKNLKADVISVNFIRGNVRNSDLKKVNFQSYKNAFLKIISANKDKKINFFFNIYKRKVIDIIERIISSGVYPIRCYAGRTFAVVDSELNIYPCEAIDKSFGNLKDYNYDFKKVWFSESANKIRSEIDNGKCVCTNECNIQNNIFFGNPTLLLKLPKERTEFKKINNALQSSGIELGENL